MEAGDRLLSGAGGSPRLLPGPEQTQQGCIPWFLCVHTYLPLHSPIIVPTAALTGQTGWGTGMAAFNVIETLRG